MPRSSRTPMKIMRPARPGDAAEHRVEQPAFTRGSRIASTCGGSGEDELEVALHHAADVLHHEGAYAALLEQTAILRNSWLRASPISLV